MGCGEVAERTIASATKAAELDGRSAAGASGERNGDDAGPSAEATGEPIEMLLEDVKVLGDPAG